MAELNIAQVTLLKQATEAYLWRRKNDKPVRDEPVREGDVFEF
jgi:hypothetical protein